MTEELAQMLEAFNEDIPERGIASWAAFIHFEKMNEVLRTLSPLPWSVRPDPERPGTFYIAGAPDSSIVAEGLTQEDAMNILYLINEMPEAVEHFEELARLWDVLVEGAPNRFDEVTAYLNTIQEYQIKIAQLEAEAAPIPEVSSAGDLSFMHIGHFIVGSGIPELDEQPIVAVSSDGDFVRVNYGRENSNLAVLPKSLPLQVEIVGSISQFKPLEETGGSPNETATPQDATD